MKQQQKPKRVRQRNPPAIGLMKSVDKLMAAEEKTQRKFHALEMKDVQKMVPNSPPAPKKPTKRWQPKKRVYGPLQEDGKMVNAPRSSRRAQNTPLPAAPITCLAPTTSGANGNGFSVAADLGTVFTSAFRMQHAWTNAVYNGFASGDCRYPDPFTLAKTSILQTRLVQNGQPSYVSGDASGDYSGFAYGLLKGSGNFTSGFSQNIEYPSASAQISWAAYNAATNPSGIRYISGSAATSYQICRPNGIVLAIKPVLRGIAHTVTVNCFPIAPMATSIISQEMTGWPTNTIEMKAGLTSAQASWGGRTFSFSADDEAIKLVCLPIDARSLDFVQGSVERAAYSATYGMAWTGWVFWINGLDYVKDTIQYTLSTVEEVMPIGNNVGIYPYPATVRKADTRLAEAAINEAVNAAEDGFTAVKWSEVLWDAAKAAAGYAVHNLVIGEDLIGTESPRSISDCLAAFPYSEHSIDRNPHDPRLRDHDPVETKRELKENKQRPTNLDDLPINLSEATKTVNALTDPPEMVTPKNARRPSLALSITSRRK